MNQTELTQPYEVLICVLMKFVVMLQPKMLCTLREMEGAFTVVCAGISDFGTHRSIWW